MSVIFFGSSKETAGAANTLEFTDATITSKQGFLTKTNIKISRYDTVGENPDLTSMGAYQETGAYSIVITIAGQISSANQDSHAIRKKIRSFGLRDQQTNALKYGQVGFELDSYPENNLNPSAARGSVILDLDTDHAEEKPNMIYFIMTIRVLGDRGIHPDYAWT